MEPCRGLGSRWDRKGPSELLRRRKGAKTIVSVIELEDQHQGASRRRYHKYNVSTRGLREGMGLAGMEAWEK